jgi:ADP-ribose pyrophosphatase YjhB (NUDIX family)/ribosomal protein S18 acetylase RimI-like enzyme
MSKTYCPRCGTLMQKREIEGRTRDVCEACRYICYRNPVPAVGVVVSLEGGIVLVRRKFEPRSNYWSLPAGYMELDESTEEAAVRECHEETGLHVQIDTLLGVYSFGSGSLSGLVIVYAATVVGGRLQAGDDASEVGIFPYDALPSPMAFHTHLQAIEHWRQKAQQPAGHVHLLVKPSQQLTVRRARDEDSQGVLALLPLLLHSEATTDSQMLMTAALFHNRVRDPDNLILVAEIEQQVAGFALLTFHRVLTGWRATIDDLVVDPVHRRCGVGQALVDSAISLVQARGCRTVHLDVPHDSADAQSFYRSCGFSEGNVATLWIG